MYLKKDFMECGWLNIAFGDEKHHFYAFCDECLSDPLPCIVRLYLHLKLGENYGFVTFGREAVDLLALRISFVDDSSEKNMVLLEFAGREVICINDKADGDDSSVKDGYEQEFYTAKLQRKLSRDTCIKMFETFIRSIVEDEGYPKQYPCNHCLEVDDFKMDYLLAEELSKMGVDSSHDNYDDIYRLMDIRITNEYTSIRADKKYYAEQFDKMLKEYIVPINWCLEDEDENRVKTIFDA